jgi:exodeoxyribonuclease VIII
MTDYYQHKAISASGLKLIAKSPAHYHASLTTPIEPTPAIAFGSAVHAAILESAEFDNRYTVMPEGLTRQSKEGKEVYAAIIASGKQVISHDDMSRIRDMQAAVNAHPAAAELLAQPAIIEKPHMFMLNGVQAKMKPDMILESRAIIDLKTTTDASPAQFQRQIMRLEMAIQAAFYTDGYERVYGHTVPFYWLAVESKAPHLVAVYQASPAMIKFGRARYLELLEIYEHCSNTGIWPGYGSSVQVMDLPEWAMQDADDFTFNDEETT